MNDKLNTILAKIKGLFYNYPLVLLMSLTTAIIIIIGIESDPKKEMAFLLLKLGFTFSLGISSQFALKMLSQRIKNGMIWQSLGLLFLIIFLLYFTRKRR